MYYSVTSIIGVPEGGDVDTGYDSDLFMMFFSQQGVSLLVFAYMIFYKSTFVNTGLPYILYPLSLTSTFEGQSMEFVEQTNSLGHRLTYFLAPDAYLGGERELVLVFSESFGIWD